MQTHKNIDFKTFEEARECNEYLGEKNSQWKEHRNNSIIVGDIFKCLTILCLYSNKNKHNMQRNGNINGT